MIGLVVVVPVGLRSVEVHLRDSNTGFDLAVVHLYEAGMGVLYNPHAIHLGSMTLPAGMSFDPGYDAKKQQLYVDTYAT